MPNTTKNSPKSQPPTLQPLNRGAPFPHFSCYCCKDTGIVSRALYGKVIDLSQYKNGYPFAVICTRYNCIRGQSLLVAIDEGTAVGDPRIPPALCQEWHEQEKKDLENLDQDREKSLKQLRARINQFKAQFGRNN